MAQRRMFSKTIIDSDQFLDMPLSTQALYFHLSMRADDEGFINNPRKIQRMIGCADDDLRVLIAKKFIIPFESGIVVIKHWKLHNYIQKDRFHETIYTEEREQLVVNPNSIYSLKTAENRALEVESVSNMDTKCIQSVSNMDTTCIQPVSSSVYNMDTQVRLGKDSKEIYCAETGSARCVTNDTKTRKTAENRALLETADTVIDYFNRVTGKRYQHSKTARQHIIARLREKYTLEDCKKVIDIKNAEWKGDSKTRAWIRPETLFSSKFESYLNQYVEPEPAVETEEYPPGIQQVWRDHNAWNNSENCVEPRVAITLDGFYTEAQKKWMHENYEY